MLSGWSSLPFISTCQGRGSPAVVPHRKQPPQRIRVLRTAASQTCLSFFVKYLVKTGHSSASVFFKAVDFPYSSHMIDMLIVFFPSYQALPTSGQVLNRGVVMPVHLVRCCRPVIPSDLSLGSQMERMLSEMGLDPRAV